MVLCLAALTPAFGREPLTPAEQRGKQLYFTGVGASGKAIQAYFGAERIPVFGELSVCSSCHGYDGLGRPESGILPSNITWKHLTKSYGHVHPSGVHHPPFDPQSLRQLLVNGLFPGGAAADPAMPVYEIAANDLDDLVAFLQRLGSLHDPGVGDETLRIGLVQTTAGETAAAQAQVVQGVVEEVNAAGGLYGRRVELVTATLPGPALRFEEFSRWLVAQDLFALVSPFTPGSEETLLATARAAEIPVVGPYTLFPPDRFADDRSVFSLFPGVAGELRLLREYLARDDEPRRVGLVSFPDPQLQQVADALRKEWRGTNWEVVDPCRLANAGTGLGACIATLRSHDVRQVLFLGFQSDLQTFLKGAAEAGWTPEVLSSGVLTGGGAGTDTYPGGLWLTFPTLARDRRPEAERALQRLAEPLPLSPQIIQAATSAAVATRLLVHALQASGRDLDRRKFVAALERLYRHETGLTPPLTFSANRRVGSRGIYVVHLPGGEGAERGRPLALEWYAPSDGRDR